MTQSDFSGVLFDLDGTLLDTALDFVPAVNQVREQMGQPPLELSNIRSHVSHGVSHMVTAVLGTDKNHPQFQSQVDALLSAYEQVLAKHARLFEGMEALLDKLELNKIPWGIVTNKPKRFTEPLMAALSLDQRCGCIVSGDTLLQRKPDPAPLEYACHQIQIQPEKALYVGDAERDIEAGNRAGMSTAVALFGYLDAQDEPGSWSADYEVASVEALSTLIFKKRKEYSE